jgi:MFS family permease
VAEGYFSRTFFALQNDRFRTFWLGTLFSFLGMQMQVLARGYLAFELTGKNSALGGVMLAFGLPQLILSLWGGVVADRFPKRTILFIAQSIIAANSAWLAFMIYFGLVEYWMLIVAGVVQGAGFAFVGPARQAFIGDLVGRQAIGNAVVLQQLSMNSTRVIGPSIAGAFIAIQFIGIGGVYLMTTLGFIITMLTMIHLPKGEPRPREDATSPMADIVDGLRYVRSRPQIALLILSSFAVIMIGFPYQSFLPSLAKVDYGVGAGALGFLNSAAAVGAVAATVWVASMSQNPKSWLYQPIAGILFAGSLIALALAPSYWVGIIVMVAVGGLASAFQSLNNSLTMMATDQMYTGRVQSISMMSWSLFGLAALPIGFVADHIGLRETLALQGVIVIVCLIALEIYGRLHNVAADRAVRAPLEQRHQAAGGGR